MYDNIYRPSSRTGTKIVIAHFYRFKKYMNPMPEKIGGCIAKSPTQFLLLLRGHLH
jgi:hypothetical protein